MNSKRLLFTTAVALAAAVGLYAAEQIDIDAGGIHVGGAAADKIGFHDAAPTAQRSSANQAALTDSTGGSISGSTLAATAGITTLSIPIQLAAMTTSAADLLTDYTPGYKFKILSVDFVTTTIGAGAGASQTINLEIGSTNLSGGVINPTLTGTNTLGKTTSGTSVTANNTGSASDTISVEVAASGTVFSAGAGIILIRIQNMDVQDNAAKTAELVNELRAALVAKGLIKGSS